MTQEAFIEILTEKGYYYRMEGDKIVITHKEYVWLGVLKTLPPDVTFKNMGDVYLRDLKTLPPGMEFENGGFVNLSSLETLPPGVRFKNRGDVYLSSLETLPPDVKFNNGGDVYLNGLGWVEDNERIKIEGVGNKRLLYLMISKGLFI